MIRTYLKLHLWLKAKCEKLTLHQRKIIFFSVSTVYFLCSIVLIVSAFIPEKERTETEQTELHEGKIKTDIPELIDTPIRKDSLHISEPFEQINT